MPTPYVIGIAGGSASGKSTFAKALKEALTGLDVHIIPVDSYFKPRNQRPYSKAPVTGAMYVDDNHPLTMDLPKLAQDLKTLIENAAHDVIVVEGLLPLWDENLLPLLNLKLFIDCRPDERIVRRLRRNMARGLTFDEIASVYLDLVRYRHDEYIETTKWRADLILNGSNPSDAALDMLVNYVKEKLTCC